MIIVTLVALALIQSTTGIDTIDLITGGQCGVTSQLQGGIVVSHQPINILPPISNDITCFFTMRAVKFRQRIRFTFLHFALTPIDCTVSNLTIYDGMDDSTPIIATICPTDNTTSLEYLSSSFWMTLKLVVTRITNPPTANFTGFWNGYTPKTPPCTEPTEEMACGNNRCIFNVLKCDGIDSCGDGTDELTTAPTFCNFSTTTQPVTANTAPPPVITATPPPAVVTTASQTTTTTATSLIRKVFPDLSPLYIILTLAFVMFAAFLVYALLSVQCFKACMLSCLHSFCLGVIRRRRQWKTMQEKPSGRLKRKITPIKRNGSMSIENLSSCELPRNEMKNGIDS